MIVPSDKLVWGVGLLGLPLALKAAVFGDLAARGACLALAAIAVVAIADALYSYRRLRPLSISLRNVGAPREPDTSSDAAAGASQNAPADPVARLTKDAAGSLELRIDHGERPGGQASPARGDTPQQLRIALELPETIASLHDELCLDLSDQSAHTIVRWPCTPSRRGQFFIRRCHCQGSSLMGLWSVRRVVPCPIEIRVYPNMLADRKHLASFFLNRGATGSHVIRQVGQGREFEKLREYVSGDSYEALHWKTTAKRGRPVTKVFQVERTQEVYIVLDSSRLSGRLVTSPPSPGQGRGAAVAPAGNDAAGVTTMLERYITASLMMAMVAQRQGDRLGLITYSDRVDGFLRAGSGAGHYNLCRERLYTVQPRPVAPDFSEIVSFIRTRLRRRALLVFLSGLDDPVVAEDFNRHVKLLTRHHLVLAGMIVAPQVRPLFSAPVQSEAEVYQHLGGHMQWQSLRQLGADLRRCGVKMALFSSERVCPQLVEQYMGLKQRQLL